MKTGVLGGTFDPVHNGHIMIACESMKQLGLGEVLFVPTAQTPLKENVPITPVEHRVRMVQLAIDGIPGFRLSTIDIDRDGTSYTIDTLEMLKEELGEGTELYFIIGQDNLETLHRWREPEKLVRLCRLVAYRRPGPTLADPAAIEKTIPGLSGRLIVLDEPEMDISATGIRERIAGGQEITGLVPGPVEEYIRDRGLYIQQTGENYLREET
jgi:nicotinate-nucleotide adenylyltransferase